jgi:hypothetical protein
MAGYSATPLAKKLGIKEGSRVFLVAAPQSYAACVAPLPPGVKFMRRMDGETDIVHLFASQRKKLCEALNAALARLKPDGVIWVSWPKKASGMATDITEDTIRDVALPLGLVDIKVCAVDDVWSGLKLVIRKELRKTLPRGRRDASQSRTQQR